MTADVSVVIPCFNLAAYLDDALQSVLDQSVPAIEIVVVDDGSDDEATRHMLASLRRPRTRVIRTSNRGVASARNTGLEACRGHYVSFLDADDVLEPRFLERTVAALESDETLAFASCWMRTFGERTFDWEPERCDLEWVLAEDTVCTAAPVRREAIIAAGGFDEAELLDGYEGWDLAISLLSGGARGVVVREQLFGYRQRAGSKWALRGHSERYAAAFAHLVAKHAAGYAAHAPAVLATIAARIEPLEGRLGERAASRPQLDERQPLASIVALEIHRRRLEEAVEETPDGDASVDWGSLRRLEPVSRVWGLDRGRPVDRCYIESFLSAHAGDITGDVLEVKDAGYTKRYGAAARSVTVLDIATANERATLLADLGAAASLPLERFDCAIVTQTLQFVYELEEAVRNLHRALRPGGVLLASIPCISRIDYEAGVDADHWRLTAPSARRLFTGCFGAGNVNVQAFGNVLACTAFLQGLAAEELDEEELERVDPYFPLVICVRAVRAAGEVAVPSAAIEGRLDEVTCSALAGWAWDRTAPERRLRLEAWAGDEHLGSVWADAARADLAAAGKADGRVAFRFALPERLHGEQRSEIRVIAPGEVALPGERPQAVRCVCAPAETAGGLAGAALDGAPLSYPWLEVTGWALGATGPVEAVELRHGGELVRRVPANLARPDIAAAFPEIAWAGASGFSARLHLLGTAGELDLEVQALLPGGAAAPVGRLEGRVARSPQTPVVVALDGAGIDGGLAALGQDAAATRVLVRRAPSRHLHPNFTPTAAWSAALDDAHALVWLCDGAEDVTSAFLERAAEALAQRPETSFAVAAETGATAHQGDLVGVVGGTALGGTLLFRAGAAALVGGVDEAAPNIAAAQWDLAVRLALARHTWTAVAAMAPGGTTLAERAGVDGARWLYRKHADVYAAQLTDILLGAEAAIGAMLRENHLLERQLEEQSRPLLRARRRERDRLGAKLRPAAERRAPWGDLARMEPVSALWGGERGLCVDRHYIERFLEGCADDVRGDVLCYEDDVYARRYGGERVVRCDVLDADPTNPAATVIADLCDAPELASASYDCVIAAQLLSVLEDPGAALRECARILRPGGVLLATVAATGRLEGDDEGRDRWRLSESAVRVMLEAAFPGARVDVRSEGGRRAVLAFLAGFAAEEIGAQSLDGHDASSPLLVVARTELPEHRVDR